MPRFVREEVSDWLLRYATEPKEHELTGPYGISLGISVQFMCVNGAVFIDAEGLDSDDAVASDWYWEETGKPLTDEELMDVYSECSGHEQMEYEWERKEAEMNLPRVFLVDKHSVKSYQAPIVIRLSGEIDATVNLSMENHFLPQGILAVVIKDSQGTIQEMKFYREGADQELSQEEVVEYATSLGWTQSS